MTRLQAFLSASSHPVENELLLLSAQVWQEVDVSRLGHILSQGDIDWDYVVVAARRQGVLPLVAQALRKHGAGQIPESTMKRFDELFRSNAVQALRLTAALAGLLTQFESEGIAAVSFKGPLLGQELYGDVTLRQFNDLDIIVPPQDLFRAITLFEHHGFHLPYQIPRSLEKAVLATEYSLSCENSEAGVSVDLHWKLFGRYLGKRFDLETAGEMTWVELEGRPVRGLSTDATLIYLCAHGAKHLWPQLESVYAVARLVQLHPDMDWDWVDKASRRLGCLRMLHLGLYLVGELFGVYPPAIKKGAFEADVATIRLAEKIIPSLFDEPNIFQPNGIHPDFSSFHFRVRDRFADAMRYVLRLVFTPSKEDWHRFSLGGSGLVVPYLLRPLRLAAGFGSARMTGGANRPAGPSEGWR